MLIDSHNHLHDPRLLPHFDDIVAGLRRLGIGKWVVNGTCQADWNEVARLAEEFPDEVIPCFGLHPWFIKDRTDDWKSELAGFLDRFIEAGLGEVGLDKWIRGHRIDEQEAVFRAQLRIAAERKRPVMIHCLKAWGRMLKVLREESTPASFPFLLHSFAGPAEVVDEFVALGGYFGFSGHFLQECKKPVQEIFRDRVPPDRLLIETDAPDMCLPESADRYGLKSDHSEKPERLNHPANLREIYEFAEEAFGATPELIARNFEKFSGRKE